MLDRRNFLVSLGAFGVLGGARVVSARAAGRDPERKLVLVQLSGGNDGLSTLVPHGDDAYHRARPRTRFEPSEVLRLDDYRGLHPELRRLRELFDGGSVALVEGVGYPAPNRSHFESLEIWHTADPRGRSAGDGWIGRLCGLAYGDEILAHRVVHLGAQAPYSLRSRTHPPACLAAPDAYRWLQNDETARGLGWDGLESGNERLELVRARMREARASSATVRSAVLRYRSPVVYPREPLAESLRTAAALIDANIGVRVVSVEQGGFDTHNDQRNRHDRLMFALDRSLGAFLEDLRRSAAGRATVVVLFSEFGRRVAENGSGGTDHGTAGPVLVLGDEVVGGLHGRRPDLEELDEGGDLVHTTDFRSVYAELAREAFGVEPEELLGSAPPAIGLL